MISITPFLKDNMEEEKKVKVLSVVTLILGILSLCLLCYWYVALGCSIVSMLLGIYVWRTYGRNRMIVVAMVCAGFNLLVVVMLLLSMGLYYNIIDLKRT